MKTILKIALSGVVLCGMSLLFDGCVAEGDGYASGGVYYGDDDGGPWFHDGVWINGSRGYYEAHHYHHGGDVYINPPRVRGPSRPHTSAPRAAPHSAPARPSGNNRDHQH